MTGVSRFLEGVTVLDCTRLLPGAVASLHLADMGAEVIKIEQPGVGDYARRLGATDATDGLLFRTTNRNKKSVTLNLKARRGREIFMALAAQEADVILEGYRPGVAKRLGIGYEDCRSVNPALIYASLTGWGQSGPFARLAGHDLNYLGVAGLAGLSASSDGEPVVPGTQVADLSGSVHAVVAVLGALYGRGTTGEGTYLDVAMLDGILTWEVVVASEQFSNGNAVKPGGHPLTGGVVSYNVYRTEDERHVTLGAVEQKFWTAFCEAVGRPDWSERRMEAANKRGFHRELIELFRSRTLEQWARLGEKADCCLFPVLTMDEVWGHPQVASREITAEWGTEDAGRTTGFRFPIKTIGDQENMSPSPRLGEHNSEVFGRVGIDREELMGLAGERVV